MLLSKICTLYTYPECQSHKCGRKCFSQNHFVSCEHVVLLPSEIIDFIIILENLK